MAITRIGQYPFEQNYPQSPSQLDRGLYKMTGDLRRYGEGDTNPYTGARSLQWSSRQDFGIGWPVSGGEDDLRGGFFMASGHGTTDEHVLVRMYESNNSTPLVSVLFSTDRSVIELEVNGSVVQQTNFVDFPHLMDSRVIYNHHGFHVIGGSRFVYYLDGVPAIDYTNAGVPSAYEYVWFFLAGGSGWGASYADDMYLEAVPGEAMGVPPSYRYLNSVTDADGTVQDWAKYPNSGNDFDKVDDSGVDDEDTYVIAFTANSKEMFDTADITLPVQHTIVSAIPWTLARKRNVKVASQMRLRADDGVATIDGADQNLPGFYAELWERMLLDPQSAAWDQTSFNACEFGMETRGTV